MIVVQNPHRAGKTSMLLYNVCQFVEIYHDAYREAQAHIAELERQLRKRDRDDFVHGVTNIAAGYTTWEAQEAIAAYDKMHGGTL
ncbi:hypothetical protein [Sodalis ligni]|uniref:Uncharacterized protein n=1 Tax=Sodalis ligni TaxID=2697027 RepID=A0A4R1NIH7_9GAMM|nr:hypothetical protein [Sodalis ligni]TCL06869.1 hypothetical protein EZJ58_5166 [Sodalis ligni]